MKNLLKLFLLMHVSVISDPCYSGNSNDPCTMKRNSKSCEAETGWSGEKICTWNGTRCIGKTQEELEQAKAEAKRAREEERAAREEERRAREQAEREEMDQYNLKIDELKQSLNISPENELNFKKDMRRIINSHREAALNLLKLLAFKADESMRGGLNDVDIIAFVTDFSRREKSLAWGDIVENIRLLITDDMSAACVRAIIASGFTYHSENIIANLKEFLETNRDLIPSERRHLYVHGIVSSIPSRQEKWHSIIQKINLFINNETPDDDFLAVFKAISDLHSPYRDSAQRDRIIARITEVAFTEDNHMHSGVIRIFPKLISLCGANDDEWSKLVDRVKVTLQEGVAFEKIITYEVNDSVHGVSIKGLIKKLLKDNISINSDQHEKINNLIHLYNEKQNGAWRDRSEQERKTSVDLFYDLSQKLNQLDEITTQAQSVVTDDMDAYSAYLAIKSIIDKTK